MSRVPSIAIAFAAAAAGGCTYGWELGPSPDAGHGGSTSASSSVASTASATSTAGSSSSASTAASSSSGAPTCAELIGALVADLAAAKRCMTSPNACTTSVQDECGCAVNVGNASASAVSKYVADVQAIKSMKCSVSCKTCPTPGSSLCLPDGQQTLSCAP